MEKVVVAPCPVDELLLLSVGVLFSCIPRVTGVGTIARVPFSRHAVGKEKIEPLLQQ